MSGSSELQVALPGLMPEPEEGDAASIALETLGASNSQVEKTYVREKPDAFDWFNDEEVIIERQASVAVYRNGRSHIVIRAERADNEDEDAFIILSTTQALQRLIDALVTEKKKGGLS